MVNKNLYREEELHERIALLPPKPEYPVIPEECDYFQKHEILQKYLDDVRPYRRERVPYATKGDTGVILEQFAIKKYRQGVINYYKVDINGKIKTLRQGSVDVIC